MSQNQTPIQIIPTQAGCDLIVQCMTSGDGYQIAKVEIGNGADAGGMDAEELSNPLETLEITAAVRSGSKLALTCVLSNSNTADSFEITEYGVYATDPANEGQFVLLGYLHMDRLTTTWPAATDFGSELVLHLEVFVGPVESVSAILGSSLVYAMQEDLQDHIDDKENPHETTWEQTGAAAADHTHTAAEVGAAEAGHTHTPEEIGAAASNHTHIPVEIGAAQYNHTHKAGDITSGNLSVQRGGTGRGSWAKDKLLYASAPDTLAQLGFGGVDKVLHQAASGAPFWGYPKSVELGYYNGHAKTWNQWTEITWARGIPNLILIVQKPFGSMGNDGFAIQKNTCFGFIFPTLGFGTVYFPPYWNQNTDFDNANANWKDFVTKSVYLQCETSITSSTNKTKHRTPRSGEYQLDGLTTDVYAYIGFY